MTSHEELQAQIQIEYSKAIDASTLLAILSDYDLSDPAQLANARQTLDIIKSAAPLEEDTGFDPSGASGLDGSTDGQESGRGEDESVGARSQRAWKSQTDDTSLSQGISSLDLDGLDFPDDYSPTVKEESPDKAYTSELDVLDVAGKEKVLVGIFPSLKPFDISWTLKKCKGDAGLAIDELMTQSFLEESGSRHRGIEAFSESELLPRPRKGKGKKKVFPPSDNYTAGSTAGSPSPTESKWDTGKHDVEFIASKTGMPVQQVSSIYHKNGATLNAAISAIIEAHLGMQIEFDDPVLDLNASQLKQEFPTVPTSDLEALLQITQPFIDDARELAKALISRPAPKTPRIQLEFRHAPLQLDEPLTTIPKAHNAIDPYRPLDVASTAVVHTRERDLAYAKAHAAYRKGKSDPLMGGAAAYYSQVGREFDVRAKNAESAAADALVARQSSGTQLDLHGVNVKDALRITRERVTSWWHNLSEARAAGRGVGTGYKVVTGRGLHSDGGKSKLGPAVGKMLLREGWRVEVSSGYLIVTGVVKKR